MTQDKNIMNWDDFIESDGQEFVILPEGDYTFTVTNFERGRYPGSAKLPACNKANLTISIDNDLGNATARFDLILYRTLEWKLASFFRSIGLKKQGEKLAMDWNKIVGAHGKAHIKPRSFTDKNGNERQFNAVDHFLDLDPSESSGAQTSFVSAGDDELPWNDGGF